VGKIANPPPTKKKLIEINLAKAASVTREFVLDGENCG